MVMAASALHNYILRKKFDVTIQDLDIEVQVYIVLCEVAPQPVTLRVIRKREIFANAIG